jgi:hypothetical protein
MRTAILKIEVCDLRLVHTHGEIVFCELSDKGLVRIGRTDQGLFIRINKVSNGTGWKSLNFSWRSSQGNMTLRVCCPNMIAFVSNNRSSELQNGGITYLSQSWALAVVFVLTCWLTEILMSLVLGSSIWWSLLRVRPGDGSRPLNFLYNQEYHEDGREPPHGRIISDTQPLCEACGPLTSMWYASFVWTRLGVAALSKLTPGKPSDDQHIDHYGYTTMESKKCWIRATYCIIM